MKTCETTTCLKSYVYTRALVSHAFLIADALEFKILQALVVSVSSFQLYKINNIATFQQLYPFLSPVVVFPLHLVCAVCTSFKLVV